MCLDLGLLTVSPKACSQLIQRPEGRPQSVAVEFSSINIAKPMHMGHFRATVVGNFVRNINVAAGNKVVAINYLGDWGTQFGMLSLGFQKFGDHTLLDKDPLKHLHSVYVQACRTLGETETGKSDASALATRLENSEDPKLLDLWQRFRSLSLEELKKLYADQTPMTCKKCAERGPPYFWSREPKRQQRSLDTRKLAGGLEGLWSFQET
ncbi:unnamed protein product [Dibothriocephalus latus]|uniref:Probable arginine--tRNA ligase, mitochondrial n=1 Tax=Dibothriocephalus latus TaxID=60516 RepID=A0A3P7M7Q7_DIBLA|nr:unnamed protein product [Dibothriocephalus latus]